MHDTLIALVTGWLFGVASVFMTLHVRVRLEIAKARKQYAGLVRLHEQPAATRSADVVSIFRHQGRRPPTRPAA